MTERERFEWWLHDTYRSNYSELEKMLAWAAWQAALTVQPDKVLTGRVSP